MAWNEPGRGKDPWGDKGGNGRRGGSAPDLDDLVRNLQRKLSGLFGGGSGSGNGSTVTLLIGLLAVAWLGSGLYQIDAAETGVVTRFGAFETSTAPGLHWHLPWPIETVEKVNIAEIARFPYQTLMLTKDENIISVDLTVQYRRADPVAYLFNVRDPDQTLADVTESAIREVIGNNSLDFILGEGRAQIAQHTKELVQSTLAAYGTGIEVTSVNLQDANFPSPVQPAVRDVVKAREDRKRVEFEAQKYANDLLPRARGEAARRTQGAEAYKAEAIARAEGEAARFTQLLDAYAKAPGVTRERLYLETMEEVLGSTSKVIVTAKGSNNMMVLPLDQLLKKTGNGNGTSATSNAPEQQPEADDRSNPRNRGGR